MPPTKVLALLPGMPVPVDLIDRLDESLPEPSGAADVILRSRNRWASAVLSFDSSWRAQVFPVGPLAGVKSHLSPAHEVARALQLALASVGVERRFLGLRMNMARVAGMGKACLVIPLLALMARVFLLILEWLR